MSITKTNLNQAVAILRSGGLVAFPTETVYGLGADASNPTAVAKVFQAKGRPSQHPLIVHLARAEQLPLWAKDIPPVAFTLAQAFWPGPLTMVLNKHDHVLPIITGGQDSVALRVPNHPIALQLLQAFGKGVVAPSANQFTRISPTTAQAVREELGDKVDLVVDGGECQCGIESTIVDLRVNPPRLLRPGMISQRQLAEVLAQPISWQGEPVNRVRVPGNHFLHYAPRTLTRLATTAALAQYLSSLKLGEKRVGIVTYSETARELIKAALFKHENLLKWVAMPAQASLYAQKIYSSLRLLDSQELAEIVIEMVPEQTDWYAIRDRLGKASANTWLSEKD